jgi:hypothetical protein
MWHSYSMPAIGQTILLFFCHWYVCVCIFKKLQIFFITRSYLRWTRHPLDKVRLEAIRDVLKQHGGLSPDHGLVANGCEALLSPPVECAPQCLSICKFFNSTVEPLLADTFAPTFSPKLVISINFDLCNQDTLQLRTAVFSPKSVLNREVPLYLDLDIFNYEEITLHSLIGKQLVIFVFYLW